MKLLTTAALLAGAASQAHAFSDSSPFVLFSTAKLPAPPSTAQLQTSSQVLAAAKALVASCPTKRYLLVSQPNLHAADLRDTHARDSSSSSSASGCGMPHLCRAVQDAGEQSAWSVAEVVGQMTEAPLVEAIAGACGEAASVERVDLRRVSAVSEREGEEERARRRETLGDNDYELSRLLETIDDDYTVMVFSDANEFQAYEPEFSQPVHVDMKRRAADAELSARDDSDTAPDNRPLFEKYQFFTPGIFMSFVVLAVVLSILGVGLKSLASLEVSYGAFEKDMAPAAQKKQM